VTQEPVVDKDKVGRAPSKLWVSKSVEYDTFPFSALTLLVGQQKEHPARKQLCCSCPQRFFTDSLDWTCSISRKIYQL